jgi:hypothetical protein
MKPSTLAEAQNAIRHLVTAVANAGLYSPEHPQISRLCEASRRCFENLLCDKGILSLLMVEGDVLFDDFPLPSGLHTQKLARLMERRHIHRMVVTAGVQTEELQDLTTYLATRKSAGGNPPDHGHLRFESLTAPCPPGPDKPSGVPASGDGNPLHSVKVSGQHRLAEIFEGFVHKQPVRITGLSEVVSDFIHAFHREIPSLLTLMPLRAMDEYTFTHGLNVCLLNLAQAMHLGIKGELLHDIGVAALLHDIGKLSIPVDILNKPGKLDDREWELMKQHPTEGAKRLLDSPGVPQLAILTAFEHHIRYDLSGYPTVHNQWSQHLCSQMTTISDIYDAVRTKRPYSAPQPPEKCAAILQKMAGREIHPQLAANFLYLLENRQDQP